MEDKQGLYIVAIVGIVAVIAMVILIMGGSHTTIQSGIGATDATGHAMCTTAVSSAVAYNCESSGAGSGCYQNVMRSIGCPTQY